MFLSETETRLSREVVNGFSKNEGPQSPADGEIPFWEKNFEKVEFKNVFHLHIFGSCAKSMSD